MVIKYITEISRVNELVQSMYSSFYYDCWSIRKTQCYRNDTPPKTTSSCGNQEPQSPVTWGIILHVSTCRVITLQLPPINPASPEARKEMCSNILFLPCPFLVLLCYACITPIKIALMTMVQCAILWKSERSKFLGSVPNQPLSQPGMNTDSMKMRTLEVFYECVKWMKIKCNYECVVLIFIFHLIFLCKDCSVSLVFQKKLQLHQGLFNLLLDI